MGRLILYLASIFVVVEICTGLRGTPIFPKYKGVKVTNDYHYKEFWFPQTVSGYTHFLKLYNYYNIREYYF